jgi:type II secretory pathway pseudopilin PulG
MTFLSRPKTGSPRLLRRRAGFTIVEVAMAAAIMAFAITGSIIVLKSGFTALDNARNTTLASQIIQSEMERIRLLNWSNIDAMSSEQKLTLSTLFPSNTITSKFTSILASRFTAVRTATNVSGKAGEMKTITVTVSWVGIDGLSHTRSTTGSYCKNGLYDYYYTLTGT